MIKSTIHEEISTVEKEEQKFMWIYELQNDRQKLEEMSFHKFCRHILWSFLIK